MPDDEIGGLARGRTLVGWRCVWYCRGLRGGGGERGSLFLEGDARTAQCQQKAEREKTIVEAHTDPYTWFPIM